MPLIWRCVGACLFVNALVAATFAAAAKPYLVPTMSFIGPSIALSQNVFNCYVMLWVATACLGLPMLFGSRRIIWPLTAVVAMLLLGMFEYTSITCSFVIMTICYLGALVFDRPGPSPAARLIQIAITACYVISALHKIHPEWLNGGTMTSIMQGGWNVYPAWVPMFKALNITRPAAEFLSIGTIIFESLLPLGLWLPKTRKLAAVLGFLFHLSLTVLLFGIIPFFPTMMTGYLAFFKNTPAEPQEYNRAEPALALAFIALMVLVPLRFAVLDKPLMHLSFRDWAPWSMAMFLYDEKVNTLEVRWQGPDGAWHEEKMSARMAGASADKDLKALAHYVLVNHPEAVEAQADCKLLINGHWALDKCCVIRK